MNIKYNLSNGVLRFYLIGELDECTAQKSRIVLDEAIEKNISVNTIIFNLSKLTFMDSTGIGMMIGRYKKAKKGLIKIYIESPSKEIGKILQLSGLYQIMPLL
ncbi:MAG: anti-sigma factor antagonist [Clostridia bacterium]|nr:anti-sigma factor antagonist [Clostridia bacterium]